MYLLLACVSEAPIVGRAHAPTTHSTSENFHLEADADVALPFVTVGQAVPEGNLRLWAVGAGSIQGLQLDISGDFSVDGALDALAAGEERTLLVHYTGDTDTPHITTGVLSIVVDDQSLSVPLAAVVGDADLPEGDWETDAFGTGGYMPFPSAPFPDGHASYTNSTVFVFVPNVFSDPGDLGIVTHVHGFGAVITEMVPDYYFAEQHALSGRDAILILPQGPYDASDSDFGKLDGHNGLANLERDVVSVLYRDGFIHRPSIGDTVLTSHSGGYLCTANMIQQGGVPVGAVHLFDSLYGMESTFEDFAASGKIFRSVYTSTGGTDDNNRALAASLEAQGYRVSESLEDRALRQNDLNIAWTDASHSGTLSDGRAYGRWLVESGLPRSPLAPPELLSVISDGETAMVRWQPDRGAGSAHYVVEGSVDGQDWETLAETEMLQASVPARPWIRVAQAGGQPSDRYVGTGGHWLVVDGFDRVLGGSWSAFTHDFTARVGAALVEGASSASNEAVDSAEVVLGDYDGVIWLLGDESLSDDTFSEAEMAALSTYVSAGGQVIVSGAELGYASDASWLSSTLHTRYVSDDAGSDHAGGFRFGVMYPEDYPDVLSGDTVIWNYTTGGAAAVAWHHQVITVGFGLENLEDVEGALAELVAVLAG